MVSLGVAWRDRVTVRRPDDGPRYRRIGAPHDRRDLGHAIAAAFDAAATARLIAWVSTPTRTAIDDDHRSSRWAAASTTRGSTPRPPGGPSGPATGAAGDATGHRPDELVAAVDQARRQLTASTSAMFTAWATPILVTSSCRHVEATVRAGRLLSVHLDHTWLARADDSTITATVGDGLSAALHALTSVPDLTRPATAELADLLRRVRAVSHTSAGRSLSTPPVAADSDGWFDRAAHTLITLPLDDLSWHVAAARHLHQAADALTRHAPSPSAFSFGGASVARSYTTLHRTTQAVLRASAQCFTTAAVGIGALDRHGSTPDVGVLGDADTATATADVASPPTAGDPSAPERGPGSPNIPPGSTTPSTMHELSRTARVGLDACVTYVEAVYAGIDTLRRQLPAGTADTIDDDLQDLRRSIDHERHTLHDAFTTVGDPDTLRAAAWTWQTLIDEHVSTLAGIVTPPSGAHAAVDPILGTADLDLGCEDAGAHARYDAACNVEREAVAARAAVAAMLAEVGGRVHASMTALADAITFFWVTLTAAISTVEALLGVAAALAGNTLSAPTALTLATTAIRQLRGMAHLSLVTLVMADSEAATPLTFVSGHLTAYAAVKDNP